MITVNTNGQALSQAFVDALTDPALRYNAKLFMNGVELNGLIDSVTITEGSCGDEGAFSVGSVVGSTMVAVVADLRDIVKGQEIEVHIGVMTDAEAETYEYVRMGYFNVSACPRNANKTTITAYGRTVTKTACAFTPPATKTIANIVANIKSDIQAAYGINVPITVSGVPTSTTIGGTLEGLTCYQVLQILASAVGGYATDTPDGGIVIKKLTNTVSLSTNTDRMVMLPVVEENDFEITGVTCSVSEEVEVEVDKAFPGSNLQRYGAARGETYTDSVTVTLAQGYRTGGEEFFYAGSSTVNILDIETQEWDKSEDTFEATFVWGTSSEEVIIDHDDGDVVSTAKLVYNAAANTMTLALNGTVSNEYYAQWGAACGSARYSSEVHPAVSYTYGTPVTLTVENPYMTQSLFDSGLKTLVGYRYRPGTASLTYGDPRLEGTDVVEITDITGEVYSLPCHALVHSYTGGLTSTITAAVATFEENDISTALPITSSIADVASSALAAKVSADAAASSAESANQSALSAAAAAAGAGESAQYAAAQAVAADQEAKRAKAAAETASGQAQIATRSANGALNGLSTVQDVIGALEWAKTNAEFSLTDDPELEPGKTYWTLTATAVTPEGTENPSEENWYTNIGTSTEPVYAKTTDTTVQSGVTYYKVVGSAVANPVVADLGTYYEISGVDEAMADFINTHLALTDEGLYVMKDGSAWKVQVSDDGVYVLDPTGVPVNQMTGNGNIVGYEESSRLEITPSSLKAFDPYNMPFFNISYDSGEAYVWDGSLNMSTTSASIPWGNVPAGQRIKLIDIEKTISSSANRVRINDIKFSIGVTGFRVIDNVIYGYRFDPSRYRGSSYAIDSISTDNCTVSFYVTKSVEFSADEDYSDTVGYLMIPIISVPSTAVWMYFLVSVGYTASTRAVKIELTGAIADGTAPDLYVNPRTLSSWIAGSELDYKAPSFTLGTAREETEGVFSATIGQGCEASWPHLIAFGKFNTNTENNLFELGNGESDEARSNAFSVDVNGNVTALRDVTALNGAFSGDVSGTNITASGNVQATTAKLDISKYTTAGNVDKTIYDALNSLGWLSDCTES